MDIEDSTKMESVGSTNTLNKIIDKISLKYLPRAKDNKFGLYWNKKIVLQLKKIYYIIVDVMDGIDNIIDDKRFKGVHGFGGY